MSRIETSGVFHGFPGMPVLAVALALGGCNAASGPVASAPQLALERVPQAAEQVALPQGAACTDAIDKWRDVIDSDYRSGYSDPSVYAAVQKDIAQEQTACAGGRDQEAVAMVAASRKRHGYPAR